MRGQRVSGVDRYSVKHHSTTGLIFCALLPACANPSEPRDDTDVILKPSIGHIEFSTDGAEVFAIASFELGESKAGWLAARDDATYTKWPEVGEFVVSTKISQPLPLMFATRSVHVGPWLLAPTAEGWYSSAQSWRERVREPLGAPIAGTELAITLNGGTLGTQHLNSIVVPEVPSATVSALSDAEGIVLSWTPANESEIYLEVISETFSVRVRLANDGSESVVLPDELRLRLRQGEQLSLLLTAVERTEASVDGSTIEGAAVSLTRLSTKWFDITSFPVLDTTDECDDPEPITASGTFGIEASGATLSPDPCSTDVEVVDTWFRVAAEPGELVEVTGFSASDGGFGRFSVFDVCQSQTCVNRTESGMILNLYNEGPQPRTWAIRLFQYRVGSRAQINIQRTPNARTSFAESCEEGSELDSLSAETYWYGLGDVVADNDVCPAEGESINIFHNVLVPPYSWARLSPGVILETDGQECAIVCDGQPRPREHFNFGDTSEEVMVMIQGEPEPQLERDWFLKPLTISFESAAVTTFADRCDELEEADEVKAGEQVVDLRGYEADFVDEDRLCVSNGGRDGFAKVTVPAGGYTYIEADHATVAATTSCGDPTTCTEPDDDDGRWTWIDNPGDSPLTAALTLIQDVANVPKINVIEIPGSSDFLPGDSCRDLGAPLGTGTWTTRGVLSGLSVNVDPCRHGPPLPFDRDVDAIVPVELKPGQTLTAYFHALDSPRQQLILSSDCGNACEIAQSMDRAITHINESNENNVYYLILRVPPEDTDFVMYVDVR